ncbi:hypothetical protein HSBAA_31260 [Vreelandella sulfidaeris]|uniref:Peptidase S9 prolyl oligopeptidase catalytic domain-containing protein n=1 Tax=Vreelandella sulfidaeris TaxID=115553 RepID=A0A455U6N5_9GAMM|nr:hypothetical protein HSBAA_31260 [Halomonas sulfidaeris]
MDPVEVTFEHPSEYLLVSDFPGSLIDADLSTWQEYIPDIQDIEITSSADESSQPALYHNSGSDEEKPLLMVLHSWSIGYLQNIDIPLGEFAVANDWVFIHPDFRGQNDGRPESTASELVISDMEDALEYARENANIDESRIYLLGYSGGAMNALHLCQPSPRDICGVAAWVPVYDLVTWYQWNAERGEPYADEITGACGGVPTEDSEAREECAQRVLAPTCLRWRESFECSWHTVSTIIPCRPSKHFMLLMIWPPKRIKFLRNKSISLWSTVKCLKHWPSARRMKSAISSISMKPMPSVQLYLQSGPAELVLFEGEHEMLYRPGLEWLARQQR